VIPKLKSAKFDPPAAPAAAFQLPSVHPLTDFKRNTTVFRERLKDTGRPEVLTVDGRADLVVQDVAAYQRLLDELDRLQAIEGIRRGLLDVEKDRGVTPETMDAELRSRLNLPARNE
jgi:PHD/YefM family antitoxin component YafN of YafNO toxin-antitoxin module